MSRLLETAKLFHKAFGGYYSRIVLILVLSLVSSISEGIGISAVVPAFAFVSGGTPTDTVSKFIKVFFSFFHVTYGFRNILMFIAILFVVRTLMLFLVQIVTARVVFGYERDTRKKLFSLTVHDNWSHLSKQKLGHLSQILMNNVTVSSGFFTNFSVVAIIATRAVAYFAIAINVSPIVALFAFVAGAAALVLFQPIFAKGRRFSFEGEQTSRNVAHFVNQHIVGMKTVKAMGVEDPVSAQAACYFEQMRIAGIGIFTIRGVLQMAIALGGLVFIGLAFAVMYRLPGFQIATFGIIVYALNQIFTQIQLVQGQMHQMGSVLPYLTTLSQYDKEARSNLEDTQSSSSQLVFKNSIDLSHISFMYPERGAVLHDVSISIPQGSMVAIIGPSGAGKSTVADLLLRLYEPTQGSILADGTEITTIPPAVWRAKVGYVTQDIFLLNDTIANNIAFYEPLTRDEIVVAAKSAHIDEFIESLPQGYDTIVGDRGILLSGGQRQRIVLARVLARKPSLLILDEATSALDAESERAIQHTIEDLHGKITTVLIAHRISTVANADLIVTLDHGRVVESGTSDELLQKENSYFRKMSALSV